MAAPAGEPPPTVVLSYGLGADSTAILLRWLFDPTSRDFDLSELLVVSAMTGREWKNLQPLIEQHILPLMARAGVRFAQVARRGPSETDGVAVLDDSRHPEQAHLAGAYTLDEEMLTAGTVPQTGGARLCSQKAKGVPIDKFVAMATAGQPYRHAMGFELDEQGRALRDTKYNTTLRTGFYPLIEWSWDRPSCLAYIKDLLGVDWPKSACTFCPFALANLESRGRVFAGFRADPSEALVPLLMEYVSVALNPAQGLHGGKRLLNLLKAAPGMEHVLAAHAAHIGGLRWTVYEVRRVLRPRRDDPAKMANAVRSVQAVHPAGTRAAARTALAALARKHGTALDTTDGHPRLWLRRRGLTFPTAEHYYVIAPAVVPDKHGPGFDAAWAGALAAPPQPVQALLEVG
jgi:hypothetical protein